MVSYILYLTASTLIRYIPDWIAERVSTLIAFAFYAFRTGIRRNIQLNFEVLGVKGSGTFIVFKNFSKAIKDFLGLPEASKEELERRCRIKGRENIDEAVKGGRGAILISPHLGPWEIAGARLASLGYKIHTAALEHPSDRVTGFFSKKRRSWGITDYPIGECVGNLLQALRDGEVVVLLIDRNFSDRGIKLRFLGREVILPDGHIVLSMRTGAALLPCWCYYNEEGIIEIFIDEPVVVSGTGTSPADIGTICLQKIEEHIRSHYDQWFAFDHLWREN